MKYKRVVAAMLVATVVTGTLVSSTPVYYAETVNTTEEVKNKDPVEVTNPYSDNIANVLDEQMSLKRQRDSCNSSFDDMHSTADEQISDMEKISRHLNEQFEKYSDYEKLENAKNKMDEQLGEAKSLFMSTNGAYTTNEFKYNVEIAPDSQTISEVTSVFEDISTLYYDSLDNDMTVKKYRGFYDIGDERENIVKTAMSAIGKITYQWGAKAESEEMPSQLDCSGFVQWVYRSVQKESDQTLASTASIGSTYEQISKDELVPGDIGMKNPEGTCYKDANGNVFYSTEAAKASNVEYNTKLEDSVKKLKKAYKNDVSKENKSYKKELKVLKNKSAEKNTDDTVDSNSAAKAKANKSAEKKESDHDGSKNLSKKKQNKLDETEEISINEQIGDLKSKHETNLEKLKRKEKASIKKIKDQMVDEDDVTYQVGHVGIYAGKDSDGNDTWIHCTGGDINNVVLTTEDEYDGFKYFYSPIEKKLKDPELSGTRIVNLPELDSYNGGKTYEPYDKITNTTSLQYQLQQKAYTDDDGFRMVNGRYMIAVGSGVSHDIGRYVDLVLENGTVIPCIIGDAKADKHTDKEFHIMTRHSHCVSEFIVDTTVMDKDLMSTGNMSNYKDEWNSKVSKFILYDKIVN